jgi:actin related protein 2/3 complex subunit 3
VKQLTSHAMENFALPGEPGFPLNSVYSSVGANRNDAGTFFTSYSHQQLMCGLRQVDSIWIALTQEADDQRRMRMIDALRAYLTQARQEMALRLLDKVYDGGKSVGPSKWWMCFQVRSRSSISALHEA